MGAVASTSDITSTEQAPYTGLPPVATVDYETSPEKRDRTLKHLLRANHQNYSVLYSQLRYHNHLPHASVPFLLYDVVERRQWADWLGVGNGIPVGRERGDAEWNV
jgi:hypothetical protein